MQGPAAPALPALETPAADPRPRVAPLPQAGFDASLSGTTACCVLVVGRKVLVASTGDSRCVVARRKPGGHGHSGHGSHGQGGSAGDGCCCSDVEVVPLTWDAKPSLPEEQRRIAQSGAHLGWCACTLLHAAARGRAPGLCICSQQAGTSINRGYAAAAVACLPAAVASLPHLFLARTADPAPLHVVPCRRRRGEAAARRARRAGGRIPRLLPRRRRAAGALPMPPPPPAAAARCRRRLPPPPLRCRRRPARLPPPAAAAAAACVGAHLQPHC